MSSNITYTGGAFFGGTLFYGRVPIFPEKWVPGIRNFTGYPYFRDTGSYFCRAFDDFVLPFQLAAQLLVDTCVVFREYLNS